MGINPPKRYVRYQKSWKIKLIDSLGDRTRDHKVTEDNIGTTLKVADSNPEEVNFSMTYTVGKNPTKSYVRYQKSSKTIK